MAVEARRGCGYRKVGCLYLVGGGIWVACDRLPYEVGPCPTCGEGVHCKDKFPCHMCHPSDEPAFLLGVGEKYYTPESFTFEAQTMGVSKLVTFIPKKLKLGETWVYLLHKKGIMAGQDENRKPIHKMAVFAAFVPQRVEMPVWKSKLTKRKAKELEKRGITPVIIPDGDKDHAPKKRR